MASQTLVLSDDCLQGDGGFIMLEDPPTHFDENRRAGGCPFRSSSAPASSGTVSSSPATITRPRGSRRSNRYTITSLSSEWLSSNDGLAYLYVAVHLKNPAVLGEDERHVGVIEDGVALMNSRVMIWADEHHIFQPVIAAATQPVNVVALA